MTQGVLCILYDSMLEPLGAVASTGLPQSPSG